MLASARAVGGETGKLIRPERTDWGGLLSLSYNKDATYLTRQSVTLKLSINGIYSKPRSGLELSPIIIMNLFLKG